MKRQLIADQIMRQTFGRLTVIRKISPQVVECSCSCGGTKITRASSLNDGFTRTCGCATHPIKHGMTGTPEWRIWIGLQDRCDSHKNEAFEDYGGRGIFVCERWREFSAFFEDMKHRPSPLYSIERKDNNGPYSPENCKWATRDEQNNNKRNNAFIEFNGERRTIAQWSESLGIKRTTITARLRRYGYSVEEVLSIQDFRPRENARRHQEASA